MSEFQHLLLPIYRPLVGLVSGVMYGHIIFLIVGLALLIATMNIQGELRWLVGLVGLYLLGAVWLWPLLTGQQL